jgi:hypothetical protein
VLGEHVYDGFHSGWHEFHPLMAVIKVEPDRTEPSAVVTWNPKFPEGEKSDTRPDDLTVDDMKQGLESSKLSDHVRVLRDTWCRLLTAAFDEETRKEQQQLTHRWTIHAHVDGCKPVEPEPHEPSEPEPPPIH